MKQHKTSLKLSNDLRYLNFNFNFKHTYVTYYVSIADISSIQV